MKEKKMTGDRLKVVLVLGAALVVVAVLAFVLSACGDDTAYSDGDREAKGHDVESAEKIERAADECPEAVSGPAVAGPVILNNGKSRDPMTAVGVLCSNGDVILKDD